MYIIIGKSGSGKTTLVNELVTKHGFKKLITDTTRPKRKGEQEGIDYNFVSDEEFQANKEKGLYAENVTYDSSFGVVSYGSRLAAYQTASDKDVIILNPFGLKMMKDKLEDCVVKTIYLRLEDELILSRLSIRGDSKIEVERRLKTDYDDFLEIEKYCDLVIGISPQTTISDLIDIILKG